MLNRILNNGENVDKDKLAGVLTDMEARIKKLEELVSGISSTDRGPVKKAKKKVKNASKD